MVDGPQIEIQDAQCCSCQQDDVPCAIFRADDCADRVALCCHCLYVLLYWHFFPQAQLFTGTNESAKRGGSFTALNSAL